MKTRVIIGTIVTALIAGAGILMAIFYHERQNHLSH